MALGQNGNCLHQTDYLGDTALKLDVLIFYIDAVWLRVQDSLHVVGKDVRQILQRKAPDFLSQKFQFGQVLPATSQKLGEVPQDHSQ